MLYNTAKDKNQWKYAATRADQRYEPGQYGQFLRTVADANSITDSSPGSSYNLDVVPVLYRISVDHSSDQLLSLATRVTDSELKNAECSVQKL